MKKPIIKRSKIREKIKQYFFRIFFKKREKLKWLFKILLKTKYIEKQFKVLIIFYLIQIGNKNSITKQKNICLLSSWNRSITTFTKLHRLMFIENASNLFIPGYSINKW